MTAHPCTRRPIVCLPSARRRSRGGGHPLWVGTVIHRLDTDAGDHVWESPPPDDPPQAR